MTEEEAKAKWCPMTASATPGKKRTCEGSACMAWRWVEGTYFDAKRNMHVHDMAPHGVGAASGFCGLSGRP